MFRLSLLSPCIKSVLAGKLMRVVCTKVVLFKFITGSIKFKISDNVKNPNKYNKV